MSMKGMGDRVTFGHYRVLQRDDCSLWELGSDAMGVTYKALDTDLQCPVALKVISSELMADEVNRNRFLREARAAAGLRHSNLASVYHLAKDGEQFFYAMEFIEGETTESYVARFGPMSLRSALRIALQVSKALAAAARQRLVYRDIRPANIMIVADWDEEDWPLVKLIDFGQVPSVLLAHDSAGTTRAGFLGTAQFGSPEQIAEREVDARSDIYSLGCTLWYLLTGEAPFSGSLASVFAQHLDSEPPWEKLRPFPKRIRRLLRRMLRKEPSQRPASAVELRREIEQCLADVERREALAARIALPLNIGRQWMSAAPLSRRAAIFCVSVIGVGLVQFGLGLALSYYGNSERSPRSAPAMQASGVARAQDSADSNQRFAKEDPGWSYLGTNPPSRSAPAIQASGVVRAQDSAGSNQRFAKEDPGWSYPGTNPPSRSAPAMQASGVARAQDSAGSNQRFAKENPGWSYLSTWDEPFQSLALAHRLSFAETAARDPGIIGAKRWLHGDSIWDAGVAKPVAFKNDSWSGQGGRFSTALASDHSFVSGDSEDEKPAVRKGLIRHKDEVKKTTKRSVKKPPRRVESRDRDRGFSPLQEVQRVREHIREHIRRVIRRIL
jgi:serine/threonine protein kinase